MKNTSGDHPTNERYNARAVKNYNECVTQVA
jgi:hypothetical protein